MLVVYVQVQIDKCVNITHSSAMKTYHLDKTDLATCQRVQKVVQTQPGQSTLHKRHRHKYSKQAVIDTSNQKWGDLDGLQQHKADLHQAKIAAQKQTRDRWEASAEGQAQIAAEARRSEQAAAKVPGGVARLELLVTSLASQGLRLRTDSQLCNNYIRLGNGQPGEIADTMLGMKWLFDNTEYSTCVQKVKHSMHEERRWLEDSDNDSEIDSIDSFTEWQNQLNAASDFEKRQAIASWFNDYGKATSQLEDIPASLKHFVPANLRKAYGI